MILTSDDQAPQLAICGSAAGALQNMSREHMSCDIIRYSASILCVTRVMCRGCTCLLPAIASHASNRPPLTIATRCSGIEPLIDLLFGSDIACQVRQLRLPHDASHIFTGMRQRRSIKLHRAVAVARV